MDLGRQRASRNVEDRRGMGVAAGGLGVGDQVQAGDVDEALAAATAIGDDRLQQQARGRVVPEAFTHGSSEQRRRWLERGLQSGDPGDCDTFSAASL
jgi:predicted metalloprotease